MATTEQRPKRLDEVARSAVSTLDKVSRLVEGAYGSDSASAQLARQAYVHATLLLGEARGGKDSGAPEADQGAVQQAPGVFSSRSAPLASTSRFAHEEIGEELKLVQRDVTGLCVARRGELPRTDSEQRVATSLGRLDHLLRKLRNELDARALRELHRPGLSRASGYYYGEPTYQRA